MPSPDAAPAWLWVAELPGPGGALALGEDDAHYLRRVVRARPGARVTLTDGAGGVVRGELREDGGVLAHEREQVTRRARLTIACGAPEGDRADWLVEKLAELGVARLVPLVSQRGGWDAWERRQERWQRLATAALRQSCQPWRLEIAVPVPLGDWLATAPSGERWLAHPAGAPPAAGAVPGEVCGVVGPAAGFTDPERSSLDSAGFRAIRLAGARLRTETAALALAAAWAARPSAP